MSRPGGSTARGRAHARFREHTPSTKSPRPHRERHRIRARALAPQGHTRSPTCASGAWSGPGAAPAPDRPLAAIAIERVLRQQPFHRTFRPLEENEPGRFRNGFLKPSVQTLADRQDPARHPDHPRRRAFASKESGGSKSVSIAVPPPDLGRGADKHCRDRTRFPGAPHPRVEECRALLCSRRGTCPPRGP